ncbi:MAG: hypothetical protein FJ125_13785, partial [Deltaproteobacteria bacterium]|nr:hypothetical protein [Deltaproteobacteria bacterium]
MSSKIHVRSCAGPGLGHLISTTILALLPLLVAAGCDEGTNRKGGETGGSVIVSDGGTSEGCTAQGHGCPPEMFCDEATGLCELVRCQPACVAGENCEFVDGLPTCRKLEPCRGVTCKPITGSDEPIWTKCVADFAPWEASCSPACAPTEICDASSGVAKCVDRAKASCRTPGDCPCDPACPEGKICDARGEKPICVKKDEATCKKPEECCPACSGNHFCNHAEDPPVCRAPHRCVPMCWVNVEGKEVQCEEGRSCNGNTGFCDCRGKPCPGDIGTTCQRNEDCRAGAAPICLTFLEEGYCSMECRFTQCPPGSTCTNVLGMHLCLDVCSRVEEPGDPEKGSPECRDGQYPYHCMHLGTELGAECRGESVCFAESRRSECEGASCRPVGAACEETRQCRAGLLCYRGLLDGYCSKDCKDDDDCPAD